MRAKQGRYSGASLGESENVVDKQKHILAFSVTEVFGNSETSKSNTGTGTRWLVHLTVHQSGFGSRAIKLDDTGCNHFVVKIVAFTGALANSGKHGETTVGLSDVVDELHNEHSLAYTGTAEKTDLASLGVRGQKVNNLDSSDRNLLLSGLISEFGGLLVNGLVDLGVDGATLVDGLADNVDDASKSS